MLEEKHKLRVNHFEQELYTDETSADEFHLNHQGAKRFTQNMAKAFNEKY
jgi:lysophospholipase L1-like esterase